MEAAEGVLWFSDTYLEGWNGAEWVPEITCGDFLTYDRFITERTFGVKKRIFLAHHANSFDPVRYPVVKTSDGQVWVVVADNVDSAQDENYANSYLIVQADFTAEILEFQTTTLASGQQGDTVEVVVGSSVCDLEMYGLDTSDEFTDVVYGTGKVVLPSNVELTDDNELLIRGARYLIKEVSSELLTKVAKVVKRGAG